MFTELYVHVNHSVILTLVGRVLVNLALSLIVPCVLMLFQIDKAAQFLCATVRTPLRLPHGVAAHCYFHLTRHAAVVVATREASIRHAANVTAGPNASVKVERIRSSSDLNIGRK